MKLPISEKMHNKPLCNAASTKAMHKTTFGMHVEKGVSFFLLRIRSSDVRTAEYVICRCADTYLYQCIKHSSNGSVWKKGKACDKLNGSVLGK